MTHFVGNGTDALEASLVVGFPEIDRSADLRVHFGAAQFFGGRF